MHFNKGQKVRSIHGGPEMEILALGTAVAICEWRANGAVKVEVFELKDLTASVATQAQQPQPTPPPQA